MARIPIHLVTLLTVSLGAAISGLDSLKNY
jgi:hypothetical protein